MSGADKKDSPRFVFCEGGTVLMVLGSTCADMGYQPSHLILKWKEMFGHPSPEGLVSSLRSTADQIEQAVKKVTSDV